MDDQNLPRGSKAVESYYFWGQPTHEDEYTEMSGWIKCECGSDITYGEGTPFHSSWCPKYTAPKFSE